MINWLVGLDKHLRMGVLYIGFMFFIIVGAFIDNVLSILMIIIGFYLVGLLVYTNWRYNDKQSEIKKELLQGFLQRSLNTNEFQADDSQMGFGSMEAIAISEERQEFAFMTRNKETEEFKFKTISFNDVIESEIIENGISTNKTSKSSVVGGALVGGALAGGVGAVIGGLSRDTTSRESVTSMKLRVVVNDLNNPFFTLNLLKPIGEPIEKDDELYSELREHADKWHHRVSVAIKRNELNYKVN